MYMYEIAGFNFALNSGISYELGKTSQTDRKLAWLSGVPIRQGLRAYEDLCHFLPHDMEPLGPRRCLQSRLSRSVAPEVSAQSSAKNPHNY